MNYDRAIEAAAHAGHDEGGPLWSLDEWREVARILVEAAAPHIDGGFASELVLGQMQKRAERAEAEVVALQQEVTDLADIPDTTGEVVSLRHRAERAEAELSHYGRTAKELAEENANLRAEVERHKDGWDDMEQRAEKAEAELSEYQDAHLTLKEQERLTADARHWALRAEQAEAEVRFEQAERRYLEGEVERVRSILDSLADSHRLGG